MIKGNVRGMGDFRRPFLMPLTPYLNMTCSKPSAEETLSGMAV